MLWFLTWNSSAEVLDERFGMDLRTRLGFGLDDGWRSCGFCLTEDIVPKVNTCTHLVHLLASRS